MTSKASDFYNFWIFSLPFKDRHLKNNIIFLRQPARKNVSSVKMELRHWSLPGMLGLEQSGLRMGVLPCVQGLTTAGFHQSAFLLTSGLFFPGVSKSCSWIENVSPRWIKGKVYVFGSIHCSYIHWWKITRKKKGRSWYFKKKLAFSQHLSFHCTCLCKKHKFRICFPGGRDYL